MVNFCFISDTLNYLGLFEQENQALLNKFIFPLKISVTFQIHSPTL